MEDRLDPYNHKQRLDNWKKTKQIKDVSKTNEKIIIKFLGDMEIGLNISKGSVKGGRSAIRLNTLRQRLAFIAKELEDRKVKDMRQVTTQQLHKLFDDMRTGVLKTRQGTPYKSTGDYIKIFKTFWHWNQKTNKNKVEDITSDLDTRGEKPKFVYFTEQDFNKMLESASADLKPILALAFDSGQRVTEIFNNKVSDFSNDFTELNIRDETSKTFGRKIKLLLCSKQIKKYVERMELKQDDYICKITPPMINRKLRELGKKILKPEQITFKNLSLYDFRHSSACYWLPRYKNESAMKWRFGWKKSDMIHYYTEFLGMKDTITKDDLYLDITKAELEKDLNKTKKDLEELKDKVSQFPDMFKAEMEKEFNAYLSEMADKFKKAKTINDSLEVLYNITYNK